MMTIFMLSICRLKRKKPRQSPTGAFA